MPQNNRKPIATTEFGNVNQPDVLNLNETIANELESVTVSGCIPITIVPKDVRWGQDLREFLISIDTISASYGSALSVLEKSTVGEKLARDMGDDHGRIEHLNGKVGGMSLIIKNLIVEKDLLLGGMKLLFNEMKAFDLLQRENPDLVLKYHERINKADVDSKKVLSSIDKITQLVDGLGDNFTDMKPNERDVLLAHASALDQLTAENISEQALRAQQGAKIREIIGNEPLPQTAEEAGIDMTASSMEPQTSDGLIENIGPEQEIETEDDETGEEDDAPPEETPEEEEKPSAIDDMIDKVLAPKKKKENKK